MSVWRPLKLDDAAPHPVIDAVEEVVRNWDWVKRGVVRLREDGHLFAGEIIVVPAREEGLIDHLEEATEQVRALDWKLHDVVIVPVSDIEDVEKYDITQVAGAAEGPQGLPG